MKKETNTAQEQLIELEKTIKKIIRKRLKDNTLDYTVQFTVSSLDPSKVKYAAQISAPAKGVQPITFVFEKYKDLEFALKQSVENIDRKSVELAYHESRINTYNSKIDQHQKRMDELNDPEYDEVSDNIELEETALEADK